ncbi:MAG: M48 family metalloprotease [Proteobacteria bacterium]|nr:M48 family metalloprotease [Pseudomonadota bacterium]MDA1352601.1 M48 family metalloprotease [Pseudomonadota bacterium]
MKKNRRLHSPLPMLAAALTTLGLSYSPISQAKVTGADIYETTLKSTPLYQDPALDAYIKKLGEEIVAVSEMAGEKFTFTLLDSEDLNAFASRDNYIYVNRGLLNYVSNEAQLVSVLAHEVGHVTRGHVTGQEERMTGAKILSTLAAVLSNSNEVYEASMAYANSMIQSHGRRNELEADETGAEYMAKLGYDPTEMLSMLSIMKDNESLQKKRANGNGVSNTTYHGVFSSHPRNDARLRTVVTKAKSLKSDNQRSNGAEVYRDLTDGLIWGTNFAAKTTAPERYSDMNLKIRVNFPKDWVLTADKSNQSVSASPEGGAATLSMQPMPRTSQSPEEYLYNYLGVPMLADGKLISPAQLKGFTGILNTDNPKTSTRIAVIYYKLDAYVLKGEALDSDDFEKFDPLFLTAIDTFRPISRAEIAGQKPKVVKYIRATQATTYEILAKSLGISVADIDTLRIINGHYPVGEPKAGDWLKIFEQ